MQSTAVLPPALSATTTLPGSPLVSAPMLATVSRTSLPVLSNRAFVAAWNARRPQVGAPKAGAKP